MNTPQTSYQTKLSRKAVAAIGWFMTWVIMFPIFVIYGVSSMLITKVFPNKDDANTPFNISDKSKIYPKNTNKDNAFAFDDES